MGATGNLMLAGDSLNAGASIGGAYGNYMALNSRANFALQQQGINDQVASIQQDQVLRRGEDTANQVRDRGNRLVGSSVARAALEGVDVHSGAITSLTNQDMADSEGDALRASNNAWRDAWGIGFAASNQNFQTKWNALASRSNANLTLLTGGLQAIGYGLKGYRDYKSNSSGSTSQTNDLSPFDYMPAFQYYSDSSGEF